MKKTLLLSLCLLGGLTLYSAPKNWTVLSPDKRIEVALSAGEALTYRVSQDGKAVLAPSPLSMTLDDGQVLGKDALPKKVLRRTQESRLTPLFYTKSSLQDQFNELILSFKGYRLLVRVYDEGMAWRWEVTRKGPFKVQAEQATFRFDGDWNAYVSYNFYGAHFRKAVRKHIPVEKQDQFCHSHEAIPVVHAIPQWERKLLAFAPLTLTDADGRMVCITESDLLDYPGMHLGNADGDNCVEGVFAPHPKEVVQGGHNNIASVIKSREDWLACYDGGTVSFPWRIVSVRHDPVQMMDNDMVYKLATPSADGADFAWVRPGKVAWEWWNAWNIYGVPFRAGINNETYKYYIDFAARYGIEYVILDEGWSVKGKADLMQVIPEIDLPELVRYGREKGVDLILWAGWWAINKDMEGICAHYAKMGIKGWKIDFIDRDDQEAVRFYARMAETAAKYKMVVDFHGAFKPAGLCRTWPNVLNFEGVHGLENLKGNNPEQVFYDLTLPFIRGVAGPMDYTQGAMRNATKANFRAIRHEPMSQGTRCRQLALYTILFSPLNMLCDSPSHYMENPECTAFIAGIPTVWDETVALDGQIGSHVAIARRKGDVWYVGALTDWNARELTLDLSFLGEGNWQMDVFRDGPNADRAGCDWVGETRPVPASRRINVRMAPGGGWTARITRL